MSASTVKDAISLLRDYLDRNARMLGLGGDSRGLRQIRSALDTLDTLAAVDEELGGETCEPSTTTPAPAEAALRHLASGEGLYVIGCPPPDNDWAQECCFRNEYVRAVLVHEDPEAAWERVKAKARIQKKEYTVRLMVRSGVPEAGAREFLGLGAS